MAGKIFTEAYQASDGTILPNYASYLEYESRRFAKSSPMFKITEDRDIIFCNTATEANFIMLTSAIDKTAFCELRQEQGADTSFAHSCEGLDARDADGEPFYGIFGILSSDGINWKWYPIDQYINYFENEMRIGQRVSTELTTLYFSNNI